MHVRRGAHLNTQGELTEIRRDRKDSDSRAGLWAVLTAARRQPRENVSEDKRNSRKPRAKWRPITLAGRRSHAQLFSRNQPHHRSLTYAG